MRLFVYKCVLVQYPNRDAINVFGFCLDTLANVIITVNDVRVSGWFYVTGARLEKLKSLSSPDGVLSIVADPDAEMRYPRALAPPKQGQAQNTKYWFRVDNISPSGRDYDFEKLAMHVNMELTDYLISEHLKTQIQVEFFAIPTTDTRASMQPLEVLQRLQPKFTLCGTFDIPDAHNGSQQHKDSEIREMTPKEFSALFDRPKTEFVHKDAAALLDYCIIECADQAQVGLRKFNVQFASDNVAKEFKSCADTSNLETVLHELSRFDLKIIFAKSEHFKDEETSDETCLFADDGTKRVLEVLQPDASKISLSRTKSNWIYVPVYNGTTKEQIDAAIPVAVALSQFAAIPLHLTLMDLLTTSKKKKMVEYFITKSLIKRNYVVLPYPKRSAEYVKGSANDSAGGSVKEPQKGVHFADDTHEIVMIDIRSYYPSIIAEQDLCVTQPLSHINRVPCLADDIPAASRRIRKTQDYNVSKLDPFNKLTKAEKEKLVRQGKEVPMLKIKKLEAQLAPIPEAVWAGVQLRNKSTDPIVQTALKNLLSSLYGAILTRSMRYSAPALGSAVTAWGRFYIFEIGRRLNTALCDITNNDRGFLLGITDSMLLHVSKMDRKEMADLIDYNLHIMRLKRIEIKPLEFFKAVYIQHKTGYCWITDGQDRISVETCKALEPKQENVPQAEKDLYIEIISMVLSKASQESVLDFLERLVTSAEQDGVSSPAFTVGKILVKRYMSLFTPEVLKSEIFQRMARLTSVGKSVTAKTKVNSIKKSSSENGNRIHLLEAYESPHSNWHESGKLDALIGFM